MSQLTKALVTLGAVAIVAFMSLASVAGASAAAPHQPLAHSPIKHVVVIYQENHSFNDLLGQLCLQRGDCTGSATGQLSDGSTFPLTQEPDIVPVVGHTYDDQVLAMNGGAMNGWDLMRNCGANHRYQCMTQVGPGQVPTLWSLANSFAISDRTFETNASSSWGSHLNLVAATLDGFLGNEPKRRHTGSLGCLNSTDEQWRSPQGKVTWEPACVPDQFGNGPYRPSPVQYVPTIMDRLDAAGVPWRIYAPTKDGHAGGYGWSICPTFYECLSTQKASTAAPGKLQKDALAGHLPAVSFLIPVYNNSQHNNFSLMKGDNWVATNVDALMNGPEWDSTAIFIVYDDCGCFYDPVAPPPGEGIRVPAVIVSPWARRGFVDHNAATDASILAFIEHNWNLADLGQADVGSYDYADLFDFAQRPLGPIALPLHKVPLSSLRYIASHPPDLDDPT